MQKEKTKAQADEQLHQMQSVSIAALQQQNHQYQMIDQMQQQQLQRNPLSGTIEMND